MLSDSKIERLFPPVSFNLKSKTANILLSKEKKIYIITRNKSFKEAYLNFDDQFFAFLSKLPDNPVKKYVTNIYSKQLVFFGTSILMKNDPVFVKLYLLKDKLAGIILNSTILEIDVTTGETSDIGDCIYATYFGLIKAAVLCNKDRILKDMPLHSLLSNYIYRLILQSFERNILYGNKQKQFINICCIYMYFRYYINYNHESAIGIIKKEYKSLFENGILDEFIPQLEEIKKYSDIKELPKLLVDLNLLQYNPGKLLLSILKSLGNIGFYNFIGSLDQFIGMVVVSKYPQNLFPKSSVVFEKIHEGVEELLTKYLDNLGYFVSDILKDEKELIPEETE